MASNKSPLLELQKRLFASRFFTVSVLLHVILVLVFGTKKLYDSYSDPSDFTGDGGDGFMQEVAVQAPPQDTQPTQPTPTLTVPVATPTSPSMEAITTMAPTPTNFVIPSIVPSVSAPTQDLAKLPQTQLPTQSVNTQITAAQAAAIREFAQWNKSAGKGGGRGGTAKEREWEFTVYLGKYGDPSDPSRMGDWASTNWVRDNKIVGGSLSNLLYYMNNMSRGRIKANPEAVPLDLSDANAINAKRPPFILLTGHRDFVLTEKEVANLREYIRRGGCIWGDSSLPGRRSRFDIAFRREMRRIISDADKDWEPLPLTHALYTKNPYYPEIKEPPPGLNHYQEPVYALKYLDEVAIIYTANDYNDMWQIGLDDKGQPDFGKDEKGQFIAMNSQIWQNRNVFYRNIDNASLEKAYKFGTNIVTHLLSRWEDRIPSAPAAL